MKFYVKIRSPNVCFVCAHKTSAALALCKGLDGSVVIMGLFLRFLLFEFYVLNISNWQSEKISVRGTI